MKRTHGRLNPIHGFAEEAWFEVVVVRSEMVNSFQGGMSALFVALLKQAFFTEEAHHFERS